MLLVRPDAAPAEPNAAPVKGEATSVERNGSKKPIPLPSLAHPATGAQPTTRDSNIDLLVPILRCARPNKQSPYSGALTDCLFS